MTIKALTPRSEGMRRRLHEHVAQRLSKSLEKWEGKTDSLAKQEIKKARDKYRLERILEKGAACSANIAVATHVAKATHPDLKVKFTTNPNILLTELPDRPEVGSHTLPNGKSLSDTTGDGAYNSAAYELYLLLDIEFEGRSMSAWLCEQDRDAIQAFALNVDGDEEAAILANKYSDLLTEKTSQPSTDTRAKQVYWLIGDDAADDTQYQVLQPLFSSSLAHAVHAEIQDARFGEGNAEARKAKREQQAHEAGYRDYRNLVARKLGGTKPQNISQLNSERGGVNYLLASLPPKWTQARQPGLFKIESAFERFAYLEGVRELVDTLAKFLLSNPDKNVETRDRREMIERALGQQLPIFSASVQARMEPGWTREPDCELPLCEQLWLDPERMQLESREDPKLRAKDEDFKRAYTWGDWQDEVAGRFANWVNQKLRDAGLVAVGDAEFKHWGKQALIDAEWPVPTQRRSGVAS